jgi:hypothetical protein
MCDVMKNIHLYLQGKVACGHVGVFSLQLWAGQEAEGAETIVGTDHNHILGLGQVGAVVETKLVAIT